ncbi:MAG TPA: nodulation protein NfeD, partial [Thermoplasmata archaeon]|nr:nodulation protein NfeD [Thermoplasmata archaeon]
MRAGLVALAGLLLFAMLVPAVQAQSGPVLVAKIDSEITRGTVEYVRAAIERAEFVDARALVFRFDTPGGGLEETQEIQRMFLATRIPIIGWVAPAGTNAWSAGTILLESTDFAAMAPFTVIGSVQPVVITGSGFEPVTDAKILNALVASLQETLRLHARNETLASAFIRDNLNLNADEALAAGAIEAVAATIDDLLLAADGFALP